MKLTQEQLFYLIVTGALILTRIPYIGKLFRVVNTMIHECGHAAMALLLNGEVLKINLFSDTSGTTVTKTKGKFSTMMVSFSGYPFAAIISFVIFYLIKNDFITFALIILMSFALISLILFVRNWYGIFWLLFFLIASGLIYQLNAPRILYSWMVFLAALLLTDALLSALTLFSISIKNPSGAGDAHNLKMETLIPAWLWALLFCLINGYLAYLTVIHTFPSIANLF